MRRPHLTYFVELTSEALVKLFAGSEPAAGRDGPPYTGAGVADFLARTNSAVSMGLIDLTPERAAIVRDLEARGVPVTAWLLLDIAQGYWLNADNPDHGAARCRETLAWAEREGLRLHRVGLDIEFPRNDGDYLMRKGARGLFTLLRRRRSRAQVQEAERRYADLVDEIRASGRTVESYHFPYIADERQCGTMLLRRTLGLVDVAVDVDVFMLYSSYLGRLGARGYFADAGHIALGVTGGGVNAGTAEEAARVLTWERFEDDLRAAAEHTSEVYVFSLEGCVEQEFLPRIERLDWDEPATALTVAEVRRTRRIRWAARSLLRTEPVLDVILPSRRK